MPDLARGIWRQRSVIEATFGYWGTRDHTVPYMQGLSKVLDMTITDPGITCGRAPEGEAVWAHWIQSGGSGMLWDLRASDLAEWGLDLTPHGLGSDDPAGFVSVDIHSCKQYDLDAATDYTAQFWQALQITSWPVLEAPARTHQIMCEPLAEIILSPSRHRQLRRAKTRLARNGLTTTVTVISDPAEAAAMRPVIEAAHRERDRLTGRSCDLDNPHRLAGYRASWDAYAQAGLLEICILNISNGHERPEMAAYCVGFTEPPWYRVADSRIVTRWQSISPGRLLENWLLGPEKLAADPAYTWIDWMSASHPTALITS